MIDEKNVVKTIANDCEITLFFTLEPNSTVKQNVLDLLLASYERRVDKKFAGEAAKLN